ncbi:MAG: glycosyltransferase family 4 protein [Minisyncoccia bacterium]
MKIAIIQPRTPYHVAGSEKVSTKHAEFLSKLGHQIYYYTSVVKNKGETFLFKEFIAKKLPNVHIIRSDISGYIEGLYDTVPDSDHVRWVTESLAFSENIYNRLKDNKPDVILTYYLPDSLFKPTGIPNVIYLSGYPSKKILWYQAFIKFCHATISISSIVSEKWKEEISQVTLNYSLGTGVDHPIYKEDILPKAKSNLVYVGRLIERKGVLTLLEAFIKILENNHDIHLWIVGEGEFIDRLNQIIIKNNLKDKITLTGLVKNPYDYFKMADICVFPSHRGDGLMGTVLESMASGKPVISTIESGSEDVIINGENGVLVEPENIVELVDAIVNLLHDKPKRISMGEKAKKFIIENVIWEKNCKKLEGILEDVVRKTTR